MATMLPEPLAVLAVDPALCEIGAFGRPGMSLKHASKFDLDQCRPVTVGPRRATQQLSAIGHACGSPLAIPVTAQDKPLPPHSSPCQYGLASVDTLGKWRGEERASRCYSDL